MARIRTTKPEFWTDERVGECSATARLLFLGSLNFADDHGGLDRSARQLKAQVFPHDAIDCEPLLQELLAVELLIEYETGGKKYLQIKNFSKHQKVEKPARPRVPLYEEKLRTRGGVGEDSPTPPRGVAVSSLERNGREGKKRKSPPPPFDPQTVAGLDLAAWQQWTQYRATRKPAIKPISLRKAAEAMAAMGTEQQSAVDFSIAQGYQGLMTAPALRRANGTSAHPAAEQAYDALIASDGAKRDEHVQRALEVIGGWSRIRERKAGYDATQIKREFCAAWESAAKASAGAAPTAAPLAGRSQ